MKRRASNRGMALLELTCALALVGLGMFGVIQGYFVLLDSIRETHRQAVVALLLENEVETLRALARAGRVQEEARDFITGLAALDDVPGVEGRATIAPTGTPGLVKIQAVLQWRERGRLARRALTTLVATEAGAPAPDATEPASIAEEQP